MPHKLTQILLDHRASGTLIFDLAADAVPATLEDAYQVQNETVAVLGPVGAWKVQPFPETGTPFASPILTSTLFVDGATLQADDFPDVRIEVEVAVTINRNLPLVADGYSANDMRGAIGSIHIALELLVSRFSDRTKLAHLTGIADLQSTGGIVLGPAMRADILPEFGRQEMALAMDGARIATTAGNATTANVLASLAWLANHAAARGLPLKEGDVVITGARLGPVDLSGAGVQADAEGLGSVSVSFH